LEAFNCSRNKIEHFHALWAFVYREPFNGMWLLFQCATSQFQTCNLSECFLYTSHVIYTLVLAMHRSARVLLELKLGFILYSFVHMLSFLFFSAFVLCLILAHSSVHLPFLTLIGVISSQEISKFVSLWNYISAYRTSSQDGFLSRSVIIFEINYVFLSYFIYLLHWRKESCYETMKRIVHNGFSDIVRRNFPWVHAYFYLPS
jgi:hypothetical protein